MRPSVMTVKGRLNYDLAKSVVLWLWTYGEGKASSRLIERLPEGRYASGFAMR